MTLGVRFGWRSPLQVPQHLPHLALGSQSDIAGITLGNGVARFFGVHLNKIWRDGEEFKGC